MRLEVEGSGEEVAGGGPWSSRVKPAIGRDQIAL